MKRFGWILALSMVAASAGAADKTSTVQELRDTLISLQQTHKTDEDVATALKQVTLGEEMTHSAMNSLAEYLPGPLSTEQIYVLEGRSALLAPPASDLPATPAPDFAAQKAILAKAIDYVTKTFSASPRVTASKTTARFQDGVENTQIVDSGEMNHMASTNVNMFDHANLYMRLLGTHTSPVENEKGVELVPVAKHKPLGGQNGQISEGGPGPLLSVILLEAAAANKLSWLRWETISGKPAAVFSFAVEKKKAHYQIDYCCFPNTDSRGPTAYMPTDAGFQTSTTWESFKATVGYHGKLFVDPETGTILRVITQAELKPTDFVHQEDMRIDYGPVTVGDKTYVLPVVGFTFVEVVPFGDNFAHRFTVRHTLFNVTYQDYKLAGSAAQK